MSVCRVFGYYRVDRGGSWSLSSQYAWVAYRSSNTTGLRYGSLGVRLVRRCA